jgi:ABC-type multidrug transport system fused ATPase/permease subunit
MLIIGGKYYMRKLMKYFKSYKKQAILAPLFKLLEALLELFIPLIVASIIDKGIATLDKLYITKMVIIMISCGIVGLLLSVFSTILGHSIFSWCLKYFSPAFVSASKLCEPVVAAIMAGILFGEMPVILQVIGGAMIIGGVYYYSRIEREE